MDETTTPAYELPLLQALADMGGSATMPSDKLYAHFRKCLGLEAEEFDPVYARPQWVYALQWVRYNLVQQGLMDGSERGVWKITDAGRKVLEQGKVSADELAPATAAHPKPADVAFAVSVADLQRIAMQDLQRELTPKELLLVIEQLEKNLRWAATATNAIQVVVGVS